MSAERPDASARVVPLRRRHPPAGNDNRPPTPVDAGRAGPAEVGDLSRFERSAETQDDYRHRMVVNVLAFVVCILLVLAGVWLTSKLAQMRKDQDCVLSGRVGCTPVNIPVRSRW
jgi:hypothetical protein